jgi:hypothetical protein
MAPSRLFHGRYMHISVVALALIVLLVQQYSLLAHIYYGLFSVPPSAVGIASPNSAYNETTFKYRYSSVNPRVQKQVDNITSEATPRCHCVRCCEDELCGGLWAGSIGRNQGDASRFQKISLVTSHCLNDTLLT